MADSKTAIHAVVLILLLTGGEVAAVRQNVRVAALDSHGESQGLQAVGPTTWLTGGSDVCRSKDMASATHAVQRYRTKMKKLKILASELESEECSKGCMMKWKELPKRMKRFESCAKAVGLNTSESGTFRVGAPSALLEVIQHGPDALREGLRAPVEAVNKAMMRNRVFPTFDDIPDCTFVPVAFDPMAIADVTNVQSARDIFHTELFGEQCDEVSSKLYVQRLSGKQLELAQDTFQQMERMLDLVQLREDVQGTGNESASESSNANVLAKEIVDEAVNTARQKLLTAEEEAEAQSLLEVDDGDGKLDLAVLLELCIIVVTLIVVTILTTLLQVWMDQKFKKK